VSRRQDVGHHVGAESRLVRGAIGLGQAKVVERLADDAHLAVLEVEMSRLAAGGAEFVLTGKASSIQRRGRALKTASVAPSRIKAKAYWAGARQGRAGLVRLGPRVTVSCSPPRRASRAKVLP
jgi:hypothetical protein